MECNLQALQRYFQNIRKSIEPIGKLFSTSKELIEKNGEFSDTRHLKLVERWNNILNLVSIVDNIVAKLECMYRISSLSKKIECTKLIDRT